MRVATPEEAEAAVAVVCIRVAGALLVAQGSHEESCSACRAAIFVAPGSPSAPPKICIQCAAGMLGTKQ